MYEDTNGDRTLDAGDAQVVFYYDTTAERTKACVNPTDPYLICSGTSKDLDEVRYMWSAGQWLAELDALSIFFNRDATLDYISNDKKRYIFTWNDLDNNGSVADSEVLEFIWRDWDALTVPAGANRGPTKSPAVAAIIVGMLQAVSPNITADRYKPKFTLIKA